MKNQKKVSTSAGVIIIIVAVIVLFGGVFAWQYLSQPKEPVGINNDQNIVGGDRDEHGCIGSAGYSWCEVKQKCLRSWEEKCEVDQNENADWKTYTETELLNMVKNELWYNEATFFKGLENNFLILDQGTAPCPRMLIIYDLNKKEEVFTFRYCSPLDIKNNTVSFWWPDDDVQVTVQNCPESVEWAKGGLGVGIESHVLLDLATLKIKNLGESRCQARQ